MRSLIRLLCISGFSLFMATSASHAETEIKIGVLYPLTGAAAASGVELKAAAELAAAITNGEVPAPPGLVAGIGLPNLKGAKLKLVFGDHQTNPQVGATEAERLITQEHVVALVGCFLSNVTATASQVAERYGIPFLNGSSSSATLTQRGFKWFFRTTPHDELFVANFFEFFKELEKKKGIRIKTLALFNENTLWGAETARLEARLADEQGYAVTEKIMYPAKTTEMTAEVQRLKAADPDVVLQSSYLGDALLSMKTYKEQGFTPRMLLANDSGFIDTEFLRTLGRDADDVLSRDVWSLDLGDRFPLIRQVNDLMRQRNNIDFTGNSAREFTAVAVIADAINRAGSTDPEAIRQALTATDIPGQGTIMPWKGIRFDTTGQNVLGSGIIVQVQNGRYVTVWPFDIATHDPVLPILAGARR